MLRSFIKNFSFIGVSLVVCISAQCQSATMSAGTAGFYRAHYTATPQLYVPTCVELAMAASPWINGQITVTQLIQRSCNATPTLYNYCTTICTGLYGGIYATNVNATSCQQACIADHPTPQIKPWYPVYMLSGKNMPAGSCLAA